MTTLCDDWLEQQPKRANHPNPMINVHGAGPEGMRCRKCVHCVAIYSYKRHYKCDLRGVTTSKKTDHSCVNLACGRFEEGTGKIIYTR
jgi:hypothetical protein